MSKTMSVVASLFMVSGVFGGAPAGAEDIDLDALRVAMEKYKDVNVALAEGYIRDPADHCVSAESEGLPAAWGSMGIHYIHPQRLGITGTAPRVNGVGTHTDWMSPSILIYEPQADGTLALVAIENLVWQKAWKATGQPHPRVNGRAWDAMADDPATAADEAHGFEPHFDQHIWLFRDNPSGALMPFNPDVSCAHHRGS